MKLRYFIFCIRWVGATEEGECDVAIRNRILPSRRTLHRLVSEKFQLPACTIIVRSIAEITEEDYNSWNSNVDTFIFEPK